MAKNDFGYVAKIGGDTSGLELALQDAQKELQSAEQGIKALDRAIAQAAANGSDTSDLLEARESAYAAYVRNANDQLLNLSQIQGEVEQAFERGIIGAGEYATYMAQLAQATETVSQTQRQLSDDTAQATESTVKFGDIIKANVISDLTVKGIEALTNAFKELGEEIKDIAVGTASYGDTVDKQSQRLGMTIDAYQEWTYILSQNGANISTLTAGLRTLTNKIDSATSGGNAAAEAFEKLGLSAEGLKDMTGEQQFSAVVSALQKMENETDRNAVANDLLGRSYQQLIPLLNQDSDSVERLRQRAHDTNQILSAEGVEAAVNYTDAMDTLTKSIDGFKHQLGEQVLPVLTEFIDDVIDTINGVDEDQVKNMLKKIADGAKELADIIRDFINDGGIEKIIDFFNWIIDHAEGIVTALGLLAGAWGISKAAAFCEQIGKIPGLITKVTNGIAGLPGQLNNVGTAFSNIGTAASNGMSALATAVNGAETTVTVSLGAIAAAAAAAVAAIASAVAVADELNTIGNAMLYETVEAKKSKENVEEIVDQWGNISQMQGLEKYNAAVEYKEDILEREEDWNKRYKSVSDELNALQEKKFKNTDEVARQTELQNTKSTLDAEYEMLEAQKEKVNNLLDDYDSTTVGKLQETSAAQNQSIANAGRTNETALANVWDGINERTKEKMDELDHLLAVHQISEEEYRAQRKSYLEAHRNEESEEWWGYYDEVTKHYDTAAETENTAAKKFTDNSEKTTLSITKSTMENLRRIQKEQGLDDKWLEQQYLNLANSLEKGTDAYLAAYDAYLDIREKNQKAEKSAAEAEIKQIKEEGEARGKALKEAAENETKAREDAIEEHKKAVENSAREYEKSGMDMAEKVTSNGKERLVLSDWGDETKKLDKLNDSKEKLKALGVSEALLESVGQYDYKDGTQQMYINELLRMRPEQLKRYDADYQEYQSTLARTAENDVGELAAETTGAVQENVTAMYDEFIEISKEKGEAAGLSYLEGFAGAMNGVDASALADMLGLGVSSSPGKSAETADGRAAGNSGNTPGNTISGISPQTVLSINVAGTEVIKGTLAEFFMDNILSGGGLNV